MSNLDLNFGKRLQRQMRKYHAELVAVAKNSKEFDLKLKKLDELSTDLLKDLSKIGVVLDREQLPEFVQKAAARGYLHKSIF